MSHRLGGHPDFGLELARLVEVQASAILWAASFVYIFGSAPMRKYLALALLGLALAAPQSKAEARCIEAPEACYPIIRVPVEKYICSRAVFSPLD